jgi:homoserine kinase
MQQVTVRVPASTSNLGPGFDCLGVALRIYNEITVTSSPVPQQLYPRIVSQAAARFFKRTHRRAFSFSCSIAEEIPQSRGLGSSATIRLGILHGLNRLSGDALDQLTIFQLCAELERHPDNAAPATFGGFTLAVEPARRANLRKLATGGVRPTGGLSGERGVPAIQRFEVSSHLYFVLLIPAVEIRTSIARKILPLKISRVAAVENCANACAITAAFASKNYEKLRGAFADHLHQPFRAKLIPFLPRVMAAAEKAGALGAFLSGSGSAICAVTLQDPDRVAAAMKRAAGSMSSRTIITRADNRGAQVSS